MKSYRAEIEKRLPELRQYARALVADHRPDIADDLVRDALTFALRSERGWMGEDVGIRLYTRLIATNRIRVGAAMGERRSMPGASAQGGASHGNGRIGRDPAPGPSHVVSHALDRLDLMDREALLLVVLCRMDYPQVAQVLGMTVATLVTRLTHARDQLGRTLFVDVGGSAAAAPSTGVRRQQPAYLRLVKS